MELQGPGWLALGHYYCMSELVVVEIQTTVIEQKVIPMIYSIVLLYIVEVNTN